MNLNAQDCNPPTNLTVVIATDCSTAILTWEAPAKNAIKKPQTPAIERVDKNKKTSKVDFLQRKMESAAMSNSAQYAPTRNDVVFFEDFEDAEVLDLPAGWTEEALGDAWWWLVDDDSFWEEGYVAFSGLQWATCWWDEEVNRNSWMFSPGIALTQDIEYTISFWTIMGYEPGDGDNLEVKIAQSPTIAAMNSGTSIYRITNGFHPDWTQITYAYTPIVSGTYYLGFHAFTPVFDGYDILIEDVKITSDDTPPPPVAYNIYRNDILIASNITVTSYTDSNVGEGSHTWSVKQVCDEGLESEPATIADGCFGINENVKSTFYIAPNPATNNITITAINNFHTIEVISFLGQTVLAQSNAANTATLDVSNLTKGVYFVRIVSENGTSVQKFVKQ